MTAPLDRQAARARCDAIARGRHVLDLRDDGYGLQHPVRCRPDLIDCAVNRALAEGHPGYEAGKYWCDLSDDAEQWIMDPFDESATDEVLAALADLPAALDALDQADAENQRLKHDLWAKQGSIELRDAEIRRLRAALIEIASREARGNEPGSARLTALVARRALRGEV